jgi:hypothetical protein
MGTFIGDFLKASFPWVAGGAVIAIILTYGKSKKKEDKYR